VATKELPQLPEGVSLLTQQTVWLMDSAARAYLTLNIKQYSGWHYAHRWV